MNTEERSHFFFSFSSYPQQSRQGRRRRWGWTCWPACISSPSTSPPLVLLQPPSWSGKQEIRLCDIHSSTDSQEVSEVLLTVFSCSLLLCNNTGQGSMQSTSPVTRNIHQLAVNCLYSGSLTCLSDNSCSETKSHTGCIIHTFSISS